MAARAIFKARLQLGDLEVPVKLYSAVEDRRIHFRLLHEKDLVPVRQEMVHPETGEPVAFDEARRGLEVEPGTYVTLSPEELAELAPEGSREVTITRFVPTGELGHEWYDRPYWLGPDGDAGAYFALAVALAESEREGVAQWTMRKREYVGALRADGPYLELVTLRSADELVRGEELRGPARKLDDRELKMARQLIEALAVPFEPEEWTDTYRAKVLELVAAKGEGREVKLKKFRPRRREGSLEELLERSVEAARGRKSA